MYLVELKTGDNVECASIDDVKRYHASEVAAVYIMKQIDYDSLVSTQDIRECIYNYLKGSQLTKEDVLEYVCGKLSCKKSDVSKVITAMKRERIVYVVHEMGWLGID